MIFNFLIFIILSNAKTHASERPHFSEDDWNNFLRAKWVEWKEIHGKSYELPNEHLRYYDWANNFNHIRIHNRWYYAGKELYLKGLTRFSDNKPDISVAKLMPEVHVDNLFKRLRPMRLGIQDVPNEMNWFLEDLTLTNKPHGFFPYGWAFSATEAIDYQIFKASGIPTKTSVREILDCVPMKNGRYFITLDAFGYVMQNGITLDSYYPLGRNMNRQLCKRTFPAPILTISRFLLLTPEDETNLKIAVALVGPISVSIKVTGNFFFYQSGVFYDPECRQGLQGVTNHAVLLTGYGTDPEGGDFWIIKNYWGNKWGENGFARMSRNSLTNCGIATAAIHVVVA